MIHYQHAHPFDEVAVGAFKVVVELDLKRRDNEKKITLLFVEMKDMMEVLIQYALVVIGRDIRTNH